MNQWQRNVFAYLYEKCGFPVLEQMAYEATLPHYACDVCNEETPHDNGKCRYCGEGI